MFFNKQIKNHRINNLNQKILGLKKLKLDFLLIIKFNKKFSNQNPLAFIKKILLKALTVNIYLLAETFVLVKKEKAT